MAHLKRASLHSFLILLITTSLCFSSTARQLVEKLDGQDHSDGVISPQGYGEESLGLITPYWIYHILPGILSGYIPFLPGFHIPHGLLSYIPGFGYHGIGYGNGYGVGFGGGGGGGSSWGGSGGYGSGSGGGDGSGSHGSGLGWGSGSGESGGYGSGSGGGSGSYGGGGGSGDSGSGSGGGSYGGRGQGWGSGSGSGGSGYGDEGGGQGWGSGGSGYEGGGIGWGEGGGIGWGSGSGSGCGGQGGERGGQDGDCPPGIGREGRDSNLESDSYENDNTQELAPKSEHSEEGSIQGDDPRDMKQPWWFLLHLLSTVSCGDKKSP